MSTLDNGWVNDQIEAAGIIAESAEALRALLKTWQEFSLDIEQEDAVRDAFVELIVGHSLAPETPDEIWVDAQPGQIQIDDIVRVKYDAYTGAAGQVHNGRLGKVAAVRYGDVIFHSTDDRLPKLDGTHYSPHLLQKRVR